MTFQEVTLSMDQCRLKIKEYHIDIGGYQPP